MNDEMRTTNHAVAGDGEQPVRRKERRGFAMGVFGAGNSGSAVDAGAAGRQGGMIRGGGRGRRVSDGEPGSTAS